MLNMKYELNNFLTHITSLIDNDCITKEEFVEELKQVPQYSRQFQRLLYERPDWIEAAKRSCDENGVFHIRFLCEHLTLRCIPIDQPRELSLLILDGGKPVIRVLCYHRSQQK